MNLKKQKVDQKWGLRMLPIKIYSSRVRDLSYRKFGASSSQTIYIMLHFHLWRLAVYSTSTQWLLSNQNECELPTLSWRLTLYFHRRFQFCVELLWVKFTQISKRFTAHCNFCRSCYPFDQMGLTATQYHNNKHTSPQISIAFHSTMASRKIHKHYVNMRGRSSRQTDRHYFVFVQNGARGTRATATHSEAIDLLININIKIHQ